MITSKDVFAKRREGLIDEAYRMALALMRSPQADDWEKKAFCWCLIDLIKRDAKTGNQETLLHYREQLESINLDPSDELLTKGIRIALSLCNPGSQHILEAKSLSKEGRHAESVELYRKVLTEGSDDRDTQTSLGWELYKHSKELTNDIDLNIGTIKRNLNQYLKLNIEKPSTLHSRILSLAQNIAAKEDKFSMLVFSRLWNLKYLQAEDFNPYFSKDGKEYPSLAEKVIQQAGKEAATSSNTQDLNYILPHINTGIDRFADNTWLKLYKAKLLSSLGRYDEALTFGLVVTKTKSNDYWAWKLLGDIVSRANQQAVALSCYCKALSCTAEDKFTGGIRIEVARRMLETNELAAAKLEIETILQTKNKEGQKIPKEVVEWCSQSWFAETHTATSNRNFYLTHAPIAEALLFDKLHWIEANIGEKYTIPGKENKPKRKIFLKTSSIPAEASLSDSKFSRKKPVAGDSIRVKGELDENQQFKIFTFEYRDSHSSWDVFPEIVGIVDHINKEKRVLHFIVDREINGVLPLSELSHPFAEGDSIAARISKYTSKQGPAYRVHQAWATDKEPSIYVKKKFNETIHISNGMGFTDNDIFLPPPFVVKHQLEHGQQVSGTAILNFNKKKSSWGWKALSIEKN